MDFKIGDKVSAIDTIKRYQAVEMKKGASGVLIDFEEQYKNNGNETELVAVVELKSSKARVPLHMLKPYEKKIVIRLEDLPSAELLARYNGLIRSEVHSTNTLTKAYAKILNDIVRVEAELLKRMGE
jgi:hypothetical protein